MKIRLLSVMLRIAALMFSLAHPSAGLASPSSEPMPNQIEGKAYRLEQAYFVVVHVPTPDLHKVMNSVIVAVGLQYGNYDQVAYIDAPGVEQFRPLDGSKAGAQKHAAQVPSKIVSFSLAHDAALLKKALDAIYEAHSYEEPVIYVSEVWRSRSSSPDEKNLNRRWNQKD